MRRRTVLALVVAVVAVGGAIAYYSQPEPVTVRVAAVERGTVQATVANTRAGTVKAQRRAKVAPRTSGQVATLPVAQGDRVEAGDMLLELWNDDLKAELAVAEARVRASSARAEQACIQADEARRQAARQARLREQGSTSEERAEQAAAERDAAVAACRAARAEAEVATHSVDSVQAALDRTQLRAPFAGVVAEVNAELGEVVSPSPPGIPTPPAIDLIDPSAMYVSAPIDEVDAPAVRLGMPARISLDAFPDRSFAGEVTRLAPYVLDVEKQARTLEVEVAFREQPTDAELLPGYSADAEIITDVSEDVLRIPSEAVMDGDSVLVLNAGNVIEARQIEVGIRNWDNTAVLSGLTEAERVVLSPNRDELAPGVEARVGDSPAP